MEDLCVCSVCGKSVNRSNYSRHMNLHKGCDFQCEICPTVFKSKVYLKKHLKTHDNVNEFKCEKCEKVFQSKDALSKHMKCKHKNVKTNFFQAKEIL